MNKKMVLAYVCVGIAILAFAPVEILAATSDKYAGKEIAEQSNAIRDFLFGPPMRLAGVIGGAYGVLQAVLTSAVRPLLIYGGIGLAVNVVPKFIDGVFSLLLP